MIDFNLSGMTIARKRWVRVVSMGFQVRKLALLGLALVGVSAANAKTIYVNGARTSSGNGSSWSRAFVYLQNALGVANPGDNIYMAKGTYYPDDGVPNGFGDREISFVLNGVNIYGGFVGNETSFSQRNPFLNQTILSGGIWDITSDPLTLGYDRYWSLHVLVVNSSSSLDGLIVEKGRASGETAPFNRGGGALVSAGQTLTLANCTLRNNLAAQSGGAVHGNVIASNCTFQGNQVNNEYNFNSNPTRIRHWLFSPICSGGAIAGDVVATNCRFFSNTLDIQSLDLGTICSGTGGAIAGATVKATNCQFDGNQVKTYSSRRPPQSNNSSASARGGAIAAASTLTRCSFSNNLVQSSADAGYSLPGIYTATSSSVGSSVAGRVVAVNCSFTDGIATAEARSGDGRDLTCVGSAIAAEGSSNIANCIFKGNNFDSTDLSNRRNGFNATRGAVDIAADGTLPLSHSTFLDNAGQQAQYEIDPLTGDVIIVIYPGQGTAISADGSVNVISNILWYTDSNPNATFPDSVADILIRVNGRGRISNRLYPTPSTETINIVKGGFGAVGSGDGANIDFGEPPERTFFSLDPQFVNIADPVGPDGLWRTADDGFRLTASSPAIGKGKPLFLASDTADLDEDGDVAEPIPSDFSNFLRVQGGSLDLGAYEFGNITNTPDIAVIDPAGVVLDDGLSNVDLSAFAAIPKAFTIKNVGLQPLRNIKIAGTGVNIGDFAYTQPPVNFLPAGASTTFTVTFNPSALGDRKATIQVLSNDPYENPFDIDVLGNAPLPDIAIEYPLGKGLVSGSSSIYLGNIAASASNTTTLTIRNTGLGNLGLSGISSAGGDVASFTPSAPRQKFLPPGGTTTFDVTFKPNGNGNRASSIIVSSNDPDSESSFVIRVTGSGFFAPEILVKQPFSQEISSGDKNSFGKVQKQSQYTKTFVIANVGTASLKNLSVSLSGSKTFSISKKLKKKKLAPGASTKFKVTFNPTSVGKASAVLRIRSNDADESQIDINLVGKGVSQTKASAKGRNSSLAKAASAAFNGFGLAPSALSSGADEVVTVSRNSDGLKYLELTVKKTSEQSLGRNPVEVSSNLVDWFSGDRHTTTLEDSPALLKVRDNTPINQGEKRYIRLK